MMDDDIRRVIEASPLVAKADEIMKLVRPALHLRTEQVESLDELPLGATRLGGRPDLPRDVAWPQNGGRAMEFLAQIDLAEAAKAYLPPNLPAAGWLALFCDLEGNDWGLNHDPTGWKVLFFTGDSVLLDRKDTPAAVAVSEPCAIRFEPAYCLPDPVELVRTFFTGGDREEEAAWDYLDEHLDPYDDEPYHRIGGYPMLVQSDLGEHAGQFLLQLDSDEDGPGWMWGDAGRLYFWIAPEALKSRDFDAVCCACEYY